MSVGEAPPEVGECEGIVQCFSCGSVFAGPDALCWGVRRNPCPSCRAPFVGGEAAREYQEFAAHVSDAVAPILEAGNWDDGSLAEARAVCIQMYRQRFHAGG